MTSVPSLTASWSQLPTPQWPTLMERKTIPVSLKWTFANVSRVDNGQLGLGSGEQNPTALPETKLLTGTTRNYDCNQVTLQKAPFEPRTSTASPSILVGRSPRLSLSVAVTTPGESCNVTTPSFAGPSPLSGRLWISSVSGGGRGAEVKGLGRWV